MNENEAREILDRFQQVDGAHFISESRHAQAKGYLECFEQARPLVTALLNSRPDHTWADPDYAAFYKRFTIWEKEREQALSQWDEAQK